LLRGNVNLDEQLDVVVLVLMTVEEGTTSTTDGGGRNSTVHDTAAVSSGLSPSVGAEQLSSSTSITSAVRSIAEQVRFFGRSVGAADETCAPAVGAEFCEQV